MELIYFAAESNIITQGDNGDFFYLVKSGHFNCFVDENKVCEYISGQCFGELALLYDAPRAATVTSTADCELYKLERSVFRYTLAYNNNKTIESIKQVVNKVKLLNGLNPIQINKLINIIQIIECKQGDVIIQKGDTGNVFYIIKEGKVCCTDINNSEDKPINIELGPGSYFGERALLLSEPRAATVIAQTETILLAIGRETFNEILGDLKTILEYNISTLIISQLNELDYLLKEERQFFIDKLCTVVAKKDEILFKEKDEMREFIVVKSGKLQVLLIEINIVGEW